VAYSALQRGGNLSELTVYQWCLLRLTNARYPTTDGGRIMQHAGARTPVFEAQHGTSAPACVLLKRWSPG